MGMFDYVRCQYPLPWPEAADFGAEWQTKSPFDVRLETWEVRADGTIWHQDVDYEDHSDPEAERGSLLSIRGMMTPVNPRWVQVPWNGEFGMHHLVSSKGKQSWWYEVTFWFRDGVVKDMICEKRKSGLDCGDAA